MKVKIYALLQLVSVLFLIAWNGYANTGHFNGKTVGNLSAEYNNLFTPASYAFSIWGLIFLAMLGYSVYTVLIAFSRTVNKSSILKSTPVLVMVNVLCSLWVALWLEEMIVWSVVCMLGILAFLIRAVLVLRIEQVKTTPIDRLLVWLPISLYTGWISVATVANISAWLNSVLSISLGTQQVITLCMLVVCFVLYAAMVWFKNMRVYGLVGVWALLAIAVRHWLSDGASQDLHYLGITAFTIACVLASLVVFKSLRTSS